MSNIVKAGFARKVLQDGTRKIPNLPKVIFSNKYVQDFFFYAILIIAILFISSLILFVGWDTFAVDVFAARPMNFIDSFGLSLLIIVVFVFVFGLKDSK